MNREILFRAWDGKNMLIDVGTHPHICEKHDDYKDGDAGQYTISEAFDSYTLMQFTGLHDKNGTAIFEGDVVRILYTDWASNTDPDIELEDYMKSISKVGVVEYHQNGFDIKFESDRYYEPCFESIFPGVHGNIEVIGDIFTTPELLTQ